MSAAGGPTSQSEPFERRVGPHEQGTRTDVLLSQWLHEPRARAQERLRSDQVLVNGAVVAKAHRLREGDHVVVLPPPVAPAAAPPAPVPVRYEDEYLAVVAKPPGVVVHRGAGTGSAPTLVDALRHMGMVLAPAGDRPGIVHRLDRGTSGLLVVAKTPETLAGLQGLFSRREAEREYWALVDGVPAQPRATIDAPLARHPVHRTRFSVQPGGRRAISHYDVVEAFGPAAAVTVRLETGRTHQVRVHMASIGHPVTGDRQYGASRALAAELALTRPALHAQRLAFDHPVTGTRIEVTEPLPDDLVEAQARLRGTVSP